MTYIYWKYLYNEIIKILFDKSIRKEAVLLQDNENSEDLGYNELYRKVCENLSTNSEFIERNKKDRSKKKGTRQKGRRIKNIKEFRPSKSNFNGVLKKLVDNGYIIGKKVDTSNNILKSIYTLTDLGKEAVKIHILQQDKRQEIFKNIYKKIIFFHANVEEKIIDESEFLSMLKKENINREKIQWGFIDDGHDNYIQRVYRHIYSDYFAKTDDDKKYLKDNYDKHIPLKKQDIKITKFCYPSQQNRDIDIYCDEIWTIYPSGKFELKSSIYRYKNKGISYEKLIEDKNLKREEIDEALDLLQKHELIEIKSFFGNKEYVILDKRLSLLIGIIVDCLHVLFKLVVYKLEHFEEPIDVEKSLMREFKGEQEFNQILRLGELKRHDYNKEIKRCKTLADYEHILCNEDLVDSFEWETFLRDNLDKKYRFIKKIGKTDDKIKIRKYHKDNDKKLKEIIKNLSEQDVKSLVQEHRQTIKNELVQHINNIPINLEDEGIEDVKVVFEPTIKKYEFLKEFLKSILPNIFDPTDEEIKKNISDFYKDHENPSNNENDNMFERIIITERNLIESLINDISITSKNINNFFEKEKVKLN